ncbi:MAG: glycosyltransferase, partial [Candidatus Bathyarchaeia archaeon]
GASFVVRWGDEGFGMDILEGMANACPVVLNKKLGASEIVEHGTHGFIVSGFSAEEFACYISLLLENRSLVRKMGIEAWKLSKIYTWEEHAKKLASVLERARQ